MFEVQKMKIAIISDVHGNYPALSAVINDAEEKKIDKFIFVGDYIFDLPFSNEVTELIKSLNNAYVIKGNKETYLGRFETENQNNWNIDQIGALHQTFRELKKDNLIYLKDLPESCFVTLPSNKRVFVTHFINELKLFDKNSEFCSGIFSKQMEREPFSHIEFLQKAKSRFNNDAIRNIITSINAEVIISGHTHLQWYAKVNNQLVINPGSCGQPLDYNSKAAYTILEDTENGLNIYEKRIEYNIEETINISKKSTVYEKSKVWCELVFSALLTGKDSFSEFFELAHNLALEKNEHGHFFNNETWNLAGKIFFERDIN
jgi:predicted phosphodiesterase